MLSFNTTTSASNFQSASSRYSTSSSSANNGSKLFPEHFYPSGLSPRQSEAVERLRPNPVSRERTIPIQIEKSSSSQNQKPSEDVVPTLKITSPKQSIVPNFVSEQRGLQPQHASQAPSNYRQFVAAPKSPRGYGDYPEITGRPTAQAPVQIPIQTVAPARAPSPQTSRPTQETIIPTIVSSHPVYYYDNQEQPIQYNRGFCAFFF